MGQGSTTQQDEKAGRDDVVLTAPTSPNRPGMADKEATSRNAELELVLKANDIAVEAGRGEFYFILPASWLAVWHSSLTTGSPASPGPMATAELFENGNSCGKLQKGLRIGKDYRAVNPTVYYIFLALYGERGPPVARYLPSIYSANVPFSGRRRIETDHRPRAVASIMRRRAALESNGRSISSAIFSSS